MQPFAIRSAQRKFFMAARLRESTPLVALISSDDECSCNQLLIELALQFSHLEIRSGRIPDWSGVMRRGRHHSFIPYEFALPSDDHAAPLRRMTNANRNYYGYADRTSSVLFAAACTHLYGFDLIRHSCVDRYWLISAARNTLICLAQFAF